MRVLATYAAAIILAVVLAIFALWGLLIVEAVVLAAWATVLLILETEADRAHHR